MKNALVFALLLVTAGCQFTPEDRRWRHQSGIERDDIPIPRLLVSASTAAPTPKVMFKDLQDRTGAAYIQALAKYGKTADVLTAALQKPVTSSPASTDLRSFERVLTMTVSKQGFAPADRIVQSRVTLKPVGFVFDGLVAAETTYTTVAIDTITGTTSLSGTASISPTFAGGVAGAGSVNGTASKSVVDTANISRQIEQLTVNTDRGSLIVSREGERGYDLAGNTLVKLSLKQLGAPYVNNPNEEQRVVVSEMDLGHPGGWNIAKKQVLKFSVLKGLKPVDFVVEARLEYVLRHVYQGANTYREDDDDVQFVPRCITQKINLLPANQTGMQSWGITGIGSGWLKVETDTGVSQLAFQDEETAEKFIFWLQSTGANKVAGRRVLIASADDINNPHLIGRDRSTLHPESLEQAPQVFAESSGDPHWCDSPPILPRADQSNKGGS